MPGPGFGHGYPALGYRPTLTVSGARGEKIRGKCVDGTTGELTEITQGPKLSQILRLIFVTLPKSPETTAGSVKQHMENHYKEFGLG